MRLMELLAAALALSCLLATGAAQEKVRVFGDRYWHPTAPTEFVRTYVDMPKDHDGDTTPLVIGIQMTRGFLRAANDLPITWKYMANIPENQTFFGVPIRTKEALPMEQFENWKMLFPQVGRNPFVFADFTFNHNGHPLVGLYDYEHFDVRFFMVTPEWWWGEQYPGAMPVVTPCENKEAVESMYKANIPVPVDCWPGDPMLHQNVGHYTWGVGPHIYNFAEPAWQAWVQGSSIDKVDSLTWGMQDGQIPYIEAMFTRSTALESDLNECVDFADFVPKRFNTPRIVPTRKCMIAGDKAFKLEYSNFISVPGGCEDLRNSSELVGWFPISLLKPLYGDECKVPVPP